MSTQAPRPTVAREWIEPLEAVHLISPKLGGDRKAKKAIVDRLRDDAIRSTAWWLAIGADVGRPYAEPILVADIEDGDENPLWSAARINQIRQAQTKPTASTTQVGDGMAVQVFDGVKNLLLLGRQFWKSARRQDLRRWDWADGFFLITRPAGDGPSGEVENGFGAKFPVRTFALGVRFCRADIERMLGEPANSAIPAQSPPETRGAKQSQSWPNWVAALSVLVDDGQKFVSARALVRKVADRLDEDNLPHPSDNTVYAAAQAVFAALNRANLPP